MSSKIPVAISFTGVANFLGVVGIIGSLVFVALELRQSQKIALAAQQQARTEVFTNVVNSVNQASSVSLYQILSKVMANEVLTSQEKKIAENYAFQTVWIFENFSFSIELPCSVVRTNWVSRLRSWTGCLWKTSF